MRIASLTVLFPLAGLLGKQHWALDLFNHFQAQYFCLILLSMLVLAVGRHWRHLTFAAPLLLIPGVRLAPLYWPTWTDESGPHLRAATFNILGSNQRYADVVGWIRKTDPDFIYLAETHEAWGAGIAPLAESHPHAVDVFIEGNFGFSFRSKHPITRKEIHRLGKMELPLLEAVISTPSGEVTVYGAHPVPPVTAFWAQERDTYLQNLGELAKHAAGHALILGDLNTTRWSHTFKWLADAGFRDSAEGQGYSATWMRENPLMTVPIDHILTRGFRGTVRLETGPALGSDHRPLVADLAW